MNLRINQFYEDKTHGVVQFIGYQGDGLLLFDMFVRGFDRGPGSGWLRGQRLCIEPDYQRRRKGYLRPIPPPQ